MSSTADESAWPALPYAELKDTCETLQLFSQIVGKVRLARTPWLNHSWHVPLYVTARGLTSSLIPSDAGGFDLEFDFVQSVLRLRTVGGEEATVALFPRSVASFYDDVMAALAKAGIDVAIDPTPSELPNPAPFPDDTAPRRYDPEVARRFWRALASIDAVLKHFRTGFLGKASPTHLFWGSFDLAVTRFSGRRAPPHPGRVPHLPDAVVREAYSHEVSSAGFWPGGEAVPYPAFYAYAYPEPAGFRQAPVQPAETRYDAALGEFTLPYETVRASPDPSATLLAFLSSTYEAAANAAHWDRAALECGLGVPGVPRPV